MSNIILDKPAFLIGAGIFSKRVYKKRWSDNYTIIGVDGGADNLTKIGVTPDYVIGDLDSIINPNKYSKSSTVIKVAEQDTTDFEKALIYFDAPLYLCIGFTGSRFDHTIEVLHILTKFRNKTIICFHYNDLIFVVPNNWKPKLPVGTRVSLFPIEPTNIQLTSGLKYTATGLNLVMGSIISTSNETTSNQIEVKYNTGLLIGVVPNGQYLNIIKSLGL